MGYNALKKRTIYNCVQLLLTYDSFDSCIPKIKSSRQYLDNNNFSTSTSIHGQSQTYKTLWNEEISSKCWQILTPLRSLFFYFGSQTHCTCWIEDKHHKMSSLWYQKLYPVEVYPCIRVRVLLENSYPGTSSLREPATQRT